MAVCHGCMGRGWIETAGGALVHICPICKGSGWLPDIASDSTSLGIATPEEKAPVTYRSG